MPGDVLRSALYVVATPIGNLGDITLRALEVLRAVDLIAAEDTRETGRLLSHYGIDKPLFAVHGHNERSACARIIDALRSGRSIALTTDAGTPGISDPGAIVVGEVRSQGFDAIAVPGPSALAAAWSVSGMPGPGFLFHGFLPAKRGERLRVLESLAKIDYPLIFYEAPHRVLATARDLRAALGAQRRVVLVRELTKVFETVCQTSLDALESWLIADVNRQRGEFVLIVSGERVAARVGEAEAALRILLKELPAGQSARLAAHLFGVPRKTLYDLALGMRGSDRPDEDLT
jgi:16S rRNA (cytidine1402-2'-O)-methyltransferase